MKFTQSETKISGVNAESCREELSAHLDDEGETFGQWAKKAAKNIGEMLDKAGAFWNNNMGKFALASMCVAFAVGPAPGLNLLHIHDRPAHAIVIDAETPKDMEAYLDTLVKTSLGQEVQRDEQETVDENGPEYASEEDSAAEDGRTYLAERDGEDEDAGSASETSAQLREFQQLLADARAGDGGEAQTVSDNEESVQEEGPDRSAQVREFQQLLADAITYGRYNPSETEMNVFGEAAKEFPDSYYRDGMKGKELIEAAVRYRNDMNRLAGVNSKAAKYGGVTEKDESDFHYGKVSTASWKREMARGKLAVVRAIGQKDMKAGCDWRDFPEASAELSKADRDERVMESILQDPHLAKEIHKIEHREGMPKAMSMRWMR